MPYLMSLMSRPLSTTELCWKKTCQGVMVVPMLARITKSRVVEKPPWKVGLKKPLATAPQPGTLGFFIAQKAAGM